MNKTKLTTGPIFKNIVMFSLPMVIINLVQMIFHTADTAVLGIMTGDAEVAAVGACGSLISLLICLVSGYSTAANVVISRRVGARRFRSPNRQYRCCWSLDHILSLEGPLWPGGM